MKKYIILIITICIGIQAKSQNISGKVLERISSDKFNPIIGANVYWENTAPLLDFYMQKTLLREVDGLGEISQITDRILKALE